MMGVTNSESPAVVSADGPKNNAGNAPSLLA